jgi:spore coat protein CotH
MNLKVIFYVHIKLYMLSFVKMNQTKIMNRTYLLILGFLTSIFSFAQSLPHHWTLDEQNHQLHIGDRIESGIFNVEAIDTIYLEFASANWFNIMTNNFNSGAELSGTLTYQGDDYEQVGVSFKGQTSYSQTNGEEKKSFNIRMDAAVAGQDLDGYDVLNLNNCFDDPSFLREFIYLYLIRHEIPAANAAFVELVINGESWGLYPMVEQIDGGFINEWFLSNDGSRWRADVATTQGGPGGPGGPQWGDGTAALNYLGNDIADYQEYYTLKASTQSDPWTDLVHTCDVLNNTAAGELMTEMPLVLDVDRTLWFLACENVFGDDDSYIFKGKMDYYLYWEAETGRMVPIEFDGNSVLVTESANWGVFYHADDVDYPLLNKLLAVPSYRQRYLAHYRTIISELVDPALSSAIIESFGDVIDPHVAADTKKLYTYNQFVSGVTTLNASLQTRRNLVMSNTELNTIGATITDVILHSQSGDWQPPIANEVVEVTATVSSPDGIDYVTLYYSDELVGNFIQVPMLDDGNSNDGESNDGVFGASIPGMALGKVVRFYIEAIEANTAKTASYLPVGAEHDVFYYHITAAMAANTDIVINELMASNISTSVDEQSQSEDWIELYNRGTAAIDLTNYHITDNGWNLTKWQIPAGTIIEPNSYLILWADEDILDGTMHTNFKLSSDGETLTLVNSIGEIADITTFGEQQTDMGFARQPNGFGDFLIQSATFSSNNSIVQISEVEHAESIHAFPNPFRDLVQVQSKEMIDAIEIFTTSGEVVATSAFKRSIQTNNLCSGIYLMKVVLHDGTVVNFRMVKM